MKNALATELGKKVKKGKEMEEEDAMEEEEDETKDAGVCISLAIHLPYEPSGKRSAKTDRDTGASDRGKKDGKRNDSRGK